jgi:hypothetical protein
MMITMLENTIAGKVAASGTGLPCQSAPIDR